jgi:dihydropteroate synthase
MHSRHVVPLPGRPPLVLGRRALVMGILNVTPDSFSDGGQHHRVEAAVARAQRMVAEGADIIDVGGESTRPGSEPVGVQEELDRVMPVIDALVAARIGVPLSVDTYKPLVADQAMQAGASIINDVHGLLGHPYMAQIAALHGAAVIAMNWDKNRDPSLPIFDALLPYFERSIAAAKQAGIDPDRIVIDPGFGFGKTLAENYELLADVGRAGKVGSHGVFPVLVGTSRKSIIGKVLGNDPGERLAGTVATTVLGYMSGGHIFRVHDVAANRDALRIAEAAVYGPERTSEASN